MNRTTCACACAAAFLASSPSAHAQERTLHLGGNLAFAQLFGGPSAPGVSAGLHAAYGLDDMFNLLAAFDVAAHPPSRWVVLSGGLGASYLMDIGPFIPYAGALAGPAGLISVNPTCGLSIAEPCSALRINLELPFGIDYRVSKRLAVGAGGRFQLLLLGDVPWMTVSVGAKVEWVWTR